MSVYILFARTRVMWADLICSGEIPGTSPYVEAVEYIGYSDLVGGTQKSISILVYVTNNTNN